MKSSREASAERDAASPEKKQGRLEAPLVGSFALLDLPAELARLMERDLSNPACAVNVIRERIIRAASAHRCLGMSGKKEAAPKRGQFDREEVLRPG